MGDYADDGYNQMLEVEMAHEAYLYNVRHKIWKDKTGKEHEIKSMSTSHLQNCLRKINKTFRPEYKKIIENELLKRK